MTNNEFKTHHWQYPNEILSLLHEAQNVSDSILCNKLIKILVQGSLRKDGLEKVANALNKWDNTEIVKKVKSEIYKAHINSDTFNEKLNDSNQFKTLLALKTIGKSSSHKRKIRKYYRDFYEQNNIIPRGLFYNEGRKASGRKGNLSKEVENRFIQMVIVSSNFYSPQTFIPKKKRTVTSFHRRLEEEFHTIPIRSLYLLVEKHGLHKYLEKPDNKDEKVEKRFVEMVKSSSVDNSIASGCKSKNCQKIITFHNQLTKEFGEISIYALYYLAQKYNLEIILENVDHRKTHDNKNDRSAQIILKDLKSSDREIFKQWRTSNDKRKWERSVVFLEHSKLSLKEISSKIERSTRTINIWIERYNQYGLEDLKINEKRDRTKTHKKNKIITNRIIEILHQHPMDYSINRSNWSQPSIVIAYKEKYGKKISTAMVSRLIKKSGYKWKKARNVLHSSDPDYREKIGLVLKTLWALQPNEMFFFMDELGPCQVKRYGGRCYLRKNAELRIPSNQKSKGTIILSGALSVTTNQITWTYGKSKDTKAMIDLLEILFNQYYEKSKLYVTWDAASWHRSNELVEWLNKFNSKTKKINRGPIIEVVPLPTSSQFLNVIESIFSVMKRAVVHHSNYQSVNEMKEAISCHFRERNKYFKENPKRAGNKIWDLDFFNNYNDILSGNYRQY